MSSSDNWTTIESDPGVFTELIQHMGVKGVQVEELYSLDENEINALMPIYGLIFLFKWRAEKNDRKVDYASLDEVWFANQVINNACATQAIISVLFNSELELGPELANLKTFSMELPAHMKGLAIGNSEVIRKAHNSFRPPQSFTIEETNAMKDDEVYHFISYVPVNGTLYELDGLKEGPIKLCECTKDNWCTLVSPFIQDRIQQYEKNEIRFNLMAVVKHKGEALTAEIQDLQLLKEQIEMKLNAENTEILKEELENAQNRIILLQEKLAAEETKYLRWKDDNIRRKHNYVPFIFNFLKVLADKGKLKELIQMAREKEEMEEEETKK